MVFCPMATEVRVIKQVATKTVASHTDDEYLTSEELAAMLKVPVETIHMWRHRGRGPRAHKLNGRLLRFKVADVRAWLDAQADEIA